MRSPWKHQLFRTGATRVSLAASLVALLAAPALVAKDAGEEAQRITESIDVLRSLTQTPDDAIPAYILERAEAVVVIPSLVKGGFVVGAEHGKGVMSVRNRTSKQWSAPSFVKITGGSVGWQIGLQATDLVLVVTNRSGVDDLLKSEFTLGANASVAAGPVGRNAQAATDARAGAKILAYSRAKGLFAGAAIEGASLRSDDKANERFYGRAITPESLVQGAPAKTPAAADEWRDGLNRFIGAA